MSHIQVDPAFMALRNRMRDLDRERDHVRAQMADAALRAELAYVDREFWHTPEQRAAKKAALEERLAKRTSRRAKEMTNFGSYTRPGSWDDDLDNYQEPEYEETVGDYSESTGRALAGTAGGGYRIRLVRARDLTYNAYVMLPDGHCAIGKSYDEVNEARPPVYLSYAAGNTFGFYFERAIKPRGDCESYDAHNFYSAEQTGYVPGHGSNYNDYANMREHCLKLVDFFASWSVPLLKKWFCPDCGAEGSPERKLCDFCDAQSLEEEHGDYPWRPEARERADSGDSTPEYFDGTLETDWWCLSCNWPNPESTDACCNCYADKGEKPARRRDKTCADKELCVCGKCFEPTPPESLEAGAAKMLAAAEAFLETCDAAAAPKPKKSWAQVVAGK